MKRYMIVDSWGMFWTGDRWSCEASHGKLYASKWFAKLRAWHITRRGDGPCYVGEADNYVSYLSEVIFHQHERAA